jgi:peptide-methionine (S)-S-oxide reductase
VNATQDEVARATAERYDGVLRERGIGSVTTEIATAGPFYYAEEYHQQYLTANPNGYCGIGGTGVACPVGVL